MTEGTTTGARVDELLRVRGVEDLDADEQASYDLSLIHI